jgi:glycosyltransferase involved in cell wall biosynthesis
MRFSLIMATIERTQEISRFLSKLDSQTFKDFELIVVDQNPDDRLVEILQPFQGNFPILHLRPAIKGASRARNVGIKAATGEIIVFPDDDCWYPETLLEKANEFLDSHADWGGLSATTAEDGYWDKDGGPIDQFNVWKRVIEYCVFLRRDLVSTVGGFDEELGVGAGTLWGAGEITDYMLRACKAGYLIYYEPALKIYHPGSMQIKPSSGFSAAKSYQYAMGKGRVLRKSNAPIWFLAYQCAKPIGNWILGVIQQRPEKKQTSWAVFKGLVQGWRGST